MRLHFRDTFGFLLLYIATSTVLLAADDIKSSSPREGDRWEFKAETRDTVGSNSDSLQGNFVVEYRGGALKVLKVIDDKETEAPPRNVEELKRLFGFGQSDRNYFKPPLTVGDKWPVKYEYEVRGVRAKTRVEAEGTVLAVKNIDVEAGRFQVLEIKIEGTQFVPGGRQVPTELRISYSPNIGSAVKFYEDTNPGGKGAKRDVELTKFTRASNPK